jgi:uncharacterized protein
MTDLATHASTRLERFARGRNVLLTTYRRDGMPVHIAVDGDRACMRTYDKAWKWKRMRDNPEVLVAPSTFRGRPTGPALAATGRILDGQEAEHAARCLRRKYPVLHGLLIPLAHRLMRARTIHMEVRPRD